jgi:glutamyl-tRNA synthetase
MGITLVARGRDHMVNTPPQLMIYEAFGVAPPAMAHLPMMLAPNGEKLSKRHGAVSVGEYRAQGYSPEAVLNYLVRFGWSHGDQEVFSIGELVDAFNWEACGRGDGKFDAKKFLAIQHEHMKTPRLTPDDAYVARLVPFLEARGLTVDAARVLKVIPMIRERATTFVDAADRLDFVFRDAPVMDEKARDKFLVAANEPHLRALADVLAKVETWEEKPLEDATNAWLTEKALNIKDVAQPARVALTGRTASPGLFEVVAALGREGALGRLRSAAELASKR